MLEPQLPFVSAQRSKHTINPTFALQTAAVLRRNCLPSPCLLLNSLDGILVSFGDFDWLSYGERLRAQILAKTPQLIAVSTFPLCLDLINYKHAGCIVPSSFITIQYRHGRHSKS
jgi:hypothetical protein